jgi:4-amino-4-deoxy-L-arabinose transferase-like glycosyltransferase
VVPTLPRRLSTRAATEASLKKGMPADSSTWALTTGELVYAAVAAICLVVLFLGVALTKTPPRYDEPWYLATVGLFHQYGLTSAFISHLPGPPGPLYTLVQAAFEPLTHLAVPGVRLVNFILLLGTMAATAGVLYLRRATRPMIAALALIGLPTTWVGAGLALTEMPAIFFFSCSLLLLLLAIRSRRSASALTAALGGGFCLSLAIAGRQPFALVLLAIPVLAMISRQKIVLIVIYTLSAAVLPAWLFSTWGGLVPPQTAWVQGFSLSHGVLAFGYAAALMALFAPSWFHIPPAWMLLSTIPVFAANAVFPMIKVTPGFTFATRVLSPTWLALYSWALASVITAAGVLLIVAGAVRVWENRSDAEFVFLSAMLFFLLAANVTIAHTFSSRYISGCAPLVLLLGNRYWKAGWFSASRLLLGAAFGCASLATYLLWL